MSPISRLPYSGVIFESGQGAVTAKCHFCGRAGDMMTDFMSFTQKNQTTMESLYNLWRNVQKPFGYPSSQDVQNQDGFALDKRCPFTNNDGIYQH